MKSKVTERLLARTSEDVKIYVRNYSDLIVLIHATMKEKGITQKQLAEKMGKQPSEISKWLSGDHNFTLRSLSKLEAEVGVRLLEIPQPKRHTVFPDSAHKSTYRMSNNKSCRIRTTVSWTQAGKVKSDLNQTYVG